MTVTVGTNLVRLIAILVAAIATTVIVFCVWAVQVKAQTNTPAIEPISRTINLTAEQEYIIREIVLTDLKVPKAKPDAPETIGDKVPENIELYPIPPGVAEKVPQVKSHTFFVTDNDTIILVSPSDRVIAEVIKKSND